MGRNLVGDQFRIGGGGEQTPTYIAKTKTKKEQKRSSRTEEVYLSRDLGEDLKKRRSLRAEVKVQTK